MISPNYQISFKAPKSITEKKQFKQFSKSYNCSFTKTSDITVNSDNTDSITFAKVALFAGMVASGIIAFTGIKKLVQRPSASNKMLAGIFETRLQNADAIVKGMRSFCEYTYGVFVKKISIKPKIKDLPDIVAFRKELDGVKNASELFKVEDRYIISLQNWLENELSKNNSPDLVSKANELRTDLSSKISEYKKGLIERIQEQASLNDIPKKLLKGKKAKSIITSFNESIKEKIGLINDAQVQTENLAKEDVFAFQASLMYRSGLAMSTKNVLIKNFLTEVKSKLNLLNKYFNNAKSNNDLINDGAGQLLSSQDDIVKDKIFQFVNAAVKPNEKYFNFVRNMSETMNLDDIKILAERLRLRASAGGPMPYTSEQYLQLANKAEELCEICYNMLLTLFKESGKNVDLMNVDVSEIEPSAIRLSRAFGTKTVGELILRLRYKYRSNPEISESVISKIYKKYYNKFLENSTTDLIAIKRGNKLFNWSA